jgi:hypothetical protein
MDGVTTFPVNLSKIDKCPGGFIIDKRGKKLLSISSQIPFHHNLSTHCLPRNLDSQQTDMYYVAETTGQEIPVRLPYRTDSECQQGWQYTKDYVLICRPINEHKDGN